MTFDAIVAGAGIWGCTVARLLAEAGKRVLVLEKRAAVGGNCRCEIDPETGIEVHVYGSHIFHTSNEEVWRFVNRFTSFNGYRHMVLAKHNGRIYHLPIGKTLVKEFFGIDLESADFTEFTNSPIPNSSNSCKSWTDKTYGEAIFDAFIKNYTAKQWGMSADQVDPAVIKRLKVRDNYSTDYFDDPYQGIPSDGYNAMFERMLDHENIEVRVSSSLKLAGDSSKLELENGEFYIFDEIKKEAIPLFNFNSQLQLFYSGPIDALFDYKFGPLPWRTLRFETERLDVADYQGNSVVNYVDADVPFTRIHEFKHYHPGRVFDFSINRFVDLNRPEEKTIIMREYSATWRPGDEPYYPIASSESAALLSRYQSEAEKLNHPSLNIQHSNFNTSPRLIIGGRLGGYKYYDMDKSIEAALRTANEYLAK